MTLRQDLQDLAADIAKQAGALADDGNPASSLAERVDALKALTALLAVLEKNGAKPDTPDAGEPSLADMVNGMQAAEDPEHGGNAPELRGRRRRRLSGIPHSSA